MVRHTVQRFDGGNQDHISFVWSGHILHKPSCMHWYCKCKNFWHEIVVHNGQIVSRVNYVIKEIWSVYAVAWYGNTTHKNFITELSLLLSSIWCGCSIAQNQIVCLLMIPSKWKWTLSVNWCVFFYYTFNYCSFAASVPCLFQQVCAVL